MRKLTITTALLLLVALVMSGCSGLFLKGAKSGETKGSARFAVSHISPAFLAALSKGGAKGLAPAAGSKTFLAADRVDFTLYDGNGSYVDSWTVNLASSLVNGENVPAVSTRVLNPGWYSVYVYVYNLKNDVNYQLTAYGSSSLFQVLDTGITNVDILCYPNNYYYLYPNEPQYISSLPQTWVVSQVNGNVSITSTGSEQWFRFWPSSTSTRITLTPSVANDSHAALVGVVFEESGMYMGQNQVFAAAMNVEFDVSTNPYSAYYLCVLDASAVAGNRDFTVQVAPSPVVDTQVSANDVELTYYIDAGGEHWYYFDTDPNTQYWVSWNDAGNGNGAMSANVAAEAFYGTYASSDRSSLSSYVFSGLDSGYTNPQIVPASAMQQRVWIHVWDQWGSGGSFGLRVKAGSSPVFQSHGVSYNAQNGTVTATGVVYDAQGLSTLGTLHLELFNGALTTNITFDPTLSQLTQLDGNTASWSWTFSTSGLAVGNYTVQAAISDNDGMSATASDSFGINSVIIGVY